MDSWSQTGRTRSRRNAAWALETNESMFAAAYDAVRDTACLATAMGATAGSVPQGRRLQIAQRARCRTIVARVDGATSRSLRRCALVFVSGMSCLIAHFLCRLGSGDGTAVSRPTATISTASPRRNQKTKTPERKESGRALLPRCLSTMLATAALMLWRGG